AARRTSSGTGDDAVLTRFRPTGLPPATAPLVNRALLPSTSQSPAPRSIRASSPERQRSKSFSVARALQDRRDSFADDGLAHELGDAAYRSRGRILHPVWDSENPSGTAEQLYGPLIATVRDLSMAASGSVASAAATPSNQEGQLVTLPPAPSLAYRPGATTAARRRNLAARSRSVTIDTRPTLAVVVAAPEPAPSVAAVDAGSSSSRHTSRAICHALTSPFPKTRYRVGWDARATAALRWALPDRLLDWGFALASARQDTKEKEKDREQ
ncbi:hypothetical protein HK405_010210, partial [Cladochytrium tenue]